MGMKHRFRLSDMIPNAWFYKLKDMTKSRPTTLHRQQQHSSHKLINHKRPSVAAAAAAATTRAPQQPRYSSYFSVKPGRASSHHHKPYNSPVNPKASDTQFPDPPRRSIRRRKTVYKPSPSSLCSKCRDRHSSWSSNSKNKLTLLRSPDYSTSPFESSPDSCRPILAESDNDYDFASSFVPPPGTFDDQVVSAAWSKPSQSCRVSSSAADIIVDVNGHSSFGRNMNIREREKLPLIVTKPSKMGHVKAQRPVCDDQKQKTKSRPLTPRKSSSSKKKKTNSPTGIKLKANSPRRLASRKAQGGSRKIPPVTTCLSAAAGNRIGESFAVVKLPVDPERDFMESMAEMIVENGIRGSRELEDLLACYLSLNSTKYHDVIVRAFERIWFHMS